MQPPISFGQWVKNRRKALDLTQEALADRVDCAPETLRKIEADRRRPSQQLVELLADQLGISPAEREVFLFLGRNEGEADTLAPTPSTAQPRRSIGTLPTSLTPLVGRAPEVSVLREQLQRPHVRLLTLTGTGGTGKTRLALEVATQLCTTFADGVYFVPLAPIADPTLLLPTIARVLEVKEKGGQTPLAGLKQALHAKQLLLVLDNFEHVADAAREVADLVTAVPQLKILVTSRASLHLYGEHEFAVGPLSVPPLEPLPALAELATYPSVSLFVERAQAVKGSFELTATNAPVVAELCVRLDGLPLAIELAAARTKLFSPTALLARLQGRLDLLADGARNVEGRHQRLRSTIDWSYNLLTDEERRLFDRLSVFARGWTLEAAEAVCHDEVLPQSEVWTLLEQLVDKSLVVVEEQEREPWYRMLESIRVYAGERLQERPSYTKVLEQHAQYYLQLLEGAQPMLRKPQRAAWLDRLEAEQDNLRAALEWVIAHGKVETSTRMIASLVWFWSMRGSFNEGLRWFDRALVPGTALPPPVYAMLLSGVGALAGKQGSYERGLQAATKGLTVWRGMGSANGEAITLLVMATSVIGQADYTQAVQLCEASLQLFRQGGDQANIALALGSLGRASLGASDYTRALSCFAERLSLSQELQDALDIGTCLTSLGLTAALAGDYQEAEQHYRAGLRQFQTAGASSAVLECLDGFEGLGIVWAMRNEGQAPQAARLLAAVELLRSTIGVMAVEAPGYFLHEPLLDAVRRHALTVLQQQLGPACETIWATGQALTLEQAMAMALEEYYVPGGSVDD